MQDGVRSSGRRGGIMSEPDTRTMRFARVAEKLETWKKVAIAVPVLVVALYGVMGAGEDAWNVVKGFGPLETRVRDHVGAYEEHVEDYAGHEQAHAGEHGEFHALSDTLLRALEGLKERTDSVAIRQQWLACISGQDRDREAGRPVRDCTPLGSGGAP